MNAPDIRFHTTPAEATEAVARPAYGMPDDADRMAADADRMAAVGALREALPDAAAPCGRGPTVYVDRHLLHTFVTRPEALAVPDEPFRWKPVFVRRSLGLAILEHCLEGRASTPTHAAEIVTAAAVDAWRRSGDRRFGWEPWVAGLRFGARAAVLAEAITWATGALTALDWSRLPRPLRVAPPDDVWSCGVGPRVVLRGRSEAAAVTRDGRPVLVLVAAGAPPPELDAELGLPALAAVLRAPRRAHPVRVVGLWPDAGMAASAEVDGALLAACTRRTVAAVEVLAASGTAGTAAAAGPGGPGSPGAPAAEGSGEIADRATTA